MLQLCNVNNKIFLVSKLPGSTSIIYSCDLNIESKWIQKLAEGIIPYKTLSLTNLILKN